MGFTFINKLSMSAGIREQLPLAPELAEIKHARDKEIEKIFTGESGKFVVIIGPCSADNKESVCDYAGCLMKVQEKTKDKLIIIPRVYISRPRTTSGGHMGMIHQPDSEEQPDISKGIPAIRHMHIRVLWETGFSAADEMLYPGSTNYLSDMMFYVAVDTRSVKNQFHRLMASGYDMLVGMKNPTSGDPAVILNSVVATQLPHDLIFRGFGVQCPDNPPIYTIPRGAVNRRGQCTLNHRCEDLKLLSDLYNKRGLQSPVYIVDTNHVNSDKQYQEQIRIAKEMLHSRRHSRDIRNLVKSFIIGSYIEPGSQEIGEHCYGKSITDPCLRWDDMERLLYEIADDLDQHDSMIQANKNEQ